MPKYTYDRKSTMPKPKMGLNANLKPMGDVKKSSMDAKGMSKAKKTMKKGEM